MAELGEDFELGEVLLIIVAIGFGGYLIYKLIQSLPSLIGVSATNLNPTFTDKDGATLGIRCIVPAIINSGQVTDSMRSAIKVNQEATFPGLPKATVDANVDWAVNAINKEAENGPNAFQYAVNYWAGTNWGVTANVPKVSSCTGCGDVCDQSGASLCSGCGLCLLRFCPGSFLA